MESKVSKGEQAGRKLKKTGGRAGIPREFPVESLPSLVVTFNRLRKGRPRPYLNAAGFPSNLFQRPKEPGKWMG